MATVGLVHATALALEPIRTAFQTLAPELKQLHFMDEGLLGALAAEGGLGPSVSRRFLRLLTAAEESGVDLILLTCTVFGPLMPALQAFCRAPLLRADTPMIEAALAAGSRLGTVVTNPPALATLRAQVDELSRGTVALEVELVPEAFAALGAGRLDEHDRLVAAAARRVAPGADAVMLAQFSMASAARLLTDLSVPVLTSPGAAVAAVRRRITELKG